MLIEDGPISGTKLAKNMDQEFTRDQLIQFLKKQNLLDENGNPTDRGIRNGITYHEENQNGRLAKWLVFDRDCQERIQKCISHIKKEIVAKKERKKKQKTSGMERSSGNVITMDLSFLNTIPFTGFKILPVNMECIILDTETTGMTKEDEVVELGIIDIEGNVLYNALFSHEQPMNPMAQAVNHFTEEDLTGAPCIREEAGKIISLLEDKIVIGHNISFDENLLRQSFERYGISFMGFESKLDSQKIAKDFIYAKKYSLEHLANLLGIPGNEVHRAVDDCRWTLDMLKNLEKLLQITSVCK